MRILLVFLFIVFPSKHVDRISVEFTTEQASYFHNYSNDNFSQKVVKSQNKVKFLLKHFSFLELDLNFRLFPDKDYIKKLSDHEKKTINSLLAGTVLLKNYLKNISFYIKDNLIYNENSFYLTPQEVLRMREANCIGFSALSKELIDAIGLESKYVKGFYLRPSGKNSFIPIPHRWIEISLPTGAKFFYDPQYQNFKANYIVMDGNITFSNIKKFSVKIIDNNRKFSN